MTERESKYNVQQFEDLPEEFQNETPDQVIMYDWNGGVIDETE